MEPRAVHVVFRVLLPLNCFYVLMGVRSVLHARQTASLVPLYMLVVFLVDMFVWRYWAAPLLKRGPAWRRVVRFSAWIVLLILVPTLGLLAVEQRSILLAGTMAFAGVVGGAAFWLSNAILQKRC